MPTGTYFADWVADALKAFESDFGEVKVPTTLNRALQRIAVKLSPTRTPAARRSR